MSFRITFHGTTGDTEVSAPSVTKTIGVFPIHDAERVAQINQTFGTQINAWAIGQFVRLWTTSDGQIDWAVIRDGYDLRRAP